MSNKIDIPAFPSEYGYIDSNRAAANGMTLRDYFAAKAMAEILPKAVSASIQNLEVKVAQKAYKMADAMLAERNKE